MKKSGYVLALSVVLLVGCGGDESKKESSQPQTTLPASVNTNSTEPAKTSASTASAGETTYKTKCASCHGADAKGRADFPKLAGQSKAELTKKLQGYKDGTFGNKMKMVMEPNAKSLSSNQMEDISEYIASLK